MNKAQLISKIISSFTMNAYHYNERNRSYTLHTEPEITIYIGKETPKTGKPELSQHRYIRDSAAMLGANMKGEI